MRHQRGLTLVEIMIVLLIMFVLSGLLLSSVFASKASAKGAVAVSYIGQVSKGCLLYSSDNDDKVPPYCSSDVFNVSPDNLFDGPILWTISLFPYLRVSAKGSGPLGTYLAEDMPPFYFDPALAPGRQRGTSECQFGVASSWGINDAVVDKIGSPTLPGKNKVREFTSFGDPSNTVLLIQTTNFLCPQVSIPGNPIARPPYASDQSFPAAATVRKRQSGMSLVAWIDGSVKLRPYQELTTSIRYWGVNY